MNITRLVGMLFLFSFLFPATFDVRLKAESAIDLLSGFDRDRLDACYPIRNSEVSGELAKLVYRLRKADAAELKSRAVLLREQPTELASLEIGEAVELAGRLTKIRKLEVPEALVEFLELSVLHQYTIEIGPTAAARTVFAPPIDGPIAEGDRVAGVGVLIEPSDTQPVLAAGRLAWFPSQPSRVGWKLLSGFGVDLSKVAAIEARNRKSLGEEDGDAFYSMMAAAQAIAETKPAAEETNESAARKIPSPRRVSAVDLLSHSEELYGEWIRVRANTVRITRVDVTEPQRQRELGQDHYFQIDASGDLGKTIIEMQRGEGESGEPIRMSGTYPITLVSTRLPPALAEELRREGSVVAMVSQPVSIDGFFFRLWSYRNEFMQQQGVDKQVGPLLIASRWRTIAIPDDSGGGVSVLGYVMAVGIILAIVATVLWSRMNARRDAAARASRPGPEKIDIPS
jgi:hypothetical protein